MKEINEFLWFLIKEEEGMEKHFNEWFAEVCKFPFDKLTKKQKGMFLFQFAKDMKGFKHDK